MKVWTDEQDALLRKMKDERSFAGIADVINQQFGTNYNRNAVAGRMNRLGFFVTSEIKQQRHIQASTRWTAEQDEALRECLDTLCYRDIATFINHKFGTTFSKHSIAGRTKRLGLSAAKSSFVKYNPKPDGFVPRIVRTDSQRKTILELGAMECRWADEDRNEDNLHTFCGNRTGDGSSYCPAHAELNRGVGTPSERNAVNVLRKAAA